MVKAGFSSKTRVERRAVTRASNPAVTGEAWEMFNFFMSSS